MKKRIISIVTALAMLGALTAVSGCSTQTQTQTPKPTAAAVKNTEKTDEKKLLNAFTSMAGSDYLYFLPADYDGDGATEAFGITGNSSLGDELYDDVTIWFINSKCECVIAKSNTYGTLKETITVDNGSFITWCVTAGGSGSSALVLGCKDGSFFEPEISGECAGFGDRTMSYMFSDESDFDMLNCDYIGYFSYYSEDEGHVWAPLPYRYDSATREFLVIS